MLRPLLLIVLISAATAAPAQVADVRQGTNIAVALSPVDDTLVVDLLGGLWRLPASGGGAVALVPVGEGLRNPRFSPDGRRIVVQRWIDGQWDLWVYDTQIGTWEALTSTPADEQEPDFTADGRAVIFASNKTGRYALWRLGLEGDSATQLTDEPGDSSFPTVSSEGDVVYVHRSAAGASLKLLTSGGTGTEIYRSQHLLSAPSWRPGGRVVVFNEIADLRSSTLKMLVLADEPVVKDLTRSEDVFLGRVAWPSRADILYTADGQIWRRGLGDPGRKPVHLFAGVSVAIGATHRVERALDGAGPYAAAGIVRPGRSPDGELTTFAALGDVWALRHRDLERLTDDAFLDTDPYPSADGGAVVFVSDRGGNMDLWRRDLTSGVTLQLTADSAKPFLPALDASGRIVAYLETDGFGPWAESRLKLVHVAAPYQTTTVATELFDARRLSWAPEGGAVLVEARRYSRDAPRTAIRFPVERAPQAGTQSRARDVAPIQVPDDPALQWVPESPDAPYVIEVGRLFDGVRNDYLRHMDIHVSGQRITAIVRRGALPLPERVIDMRDATIIPGLIDVHVHQSALAGERLGRLWLAYGVTTVREIGEDFEGALERAESWASGRRLGPRLSSPRPRRSRTASTRVWPALRSSSMPTRASTPGLPPQSCASASCLASPKSVAWRRSGARPLPPGPRHDPGLGSEHELSGHARDRDRLGHDGQHGSGGGLGRAGGAGSGQGARRCRGAAHAADEPRGACTLVRRRRGAGAAIAALEDTIGRLVRGGGRVAVGSDAPAVPYGYGLHAELAAPRRCGHSQRPSPAARFGQWRDRARPRPSARHDRGRQARRFRRRRRRSARPAR